MRALPNSIIGLIEELEQLYPPRCIQPAENVEDHCRYAGSVDVVQILRNRFEAEIKAEKNQLPKVL